jgi:hypothetical protein
VARFVVEFRDGDGVRRETHVTGTDTVALGGVELRDGVEVVLRGRRWRVRLVVDGVVDYYILSTRDPSV